MVHRKSHFANGNDRVMPSDSTKKLDDLREEALVGSKIEDFWFLPKKVDACADSGNKIVLFLNVLLSLGQIKARADREKERDGHRYVGTHNYYTHKETKLIINGAIPELIMCL